MLLNAVIALALLVPLGLMIHHWRRHGAAGVVLSHFWYLTLIWLVCFPLRAIAVTSGGFEPWAGIDTSPEILVPALFVAVVIWLGVWAGYAVGAQPCAPANAGSRQPSHVLAVVFGLCAISLAGYVATHQFFAAAHGQNSFSARIGAGHLFLAPELFVYAAIAGLGVVLGGSPRVQKITWAFFACAIAVAVLLSMLTVSRRLVAMLVLTGAVVLALRYRKALPLLVATIIASIAGAPFMQALRALWWFHEGDLLTRIRSAANALMDQGGLAYFILHTYEGLEHLTAFITKAGWNGVVWGVDQGTSWAFNFGLAFVPRAVWPEKPLLYGNVAQQHFVHPHLFTNGLPQLTLPPSFVVDFLYGFGIVGGLVLAFGLGQLLQWLETAMRSPTAAVPLRIFAVFAFAHTFAIVRSGTGFGQVLVMFGAVLVAVYGVRWVFALIPGRYKTR